MDLKSGARETKEITLRLRAGLINYNFQFVFIPQELVQNMTINYLLYRNCKDLPKKLIKTDKVLVFAFR